MCVMQKIVCKSSIKCNKKSAKIGWSCHKFWNSCCKIMLQIWLICSKCAAKQFFVLKWAKSVKEIYIQSTCANLCIFGKEMLHICSFLHIFAISCKYIKVYGKVTFCSHFIECLFRFRGRKKIDVSRRTYNCKHLLLSELMKVFDISWKLNH